MLVSSGWSALMSAPWGKFDAVSKQAKVDAQKAFTGCERRGTMKARAYNLYRRLRNTKGKWELIGGAYGMPRQMAVRFFQNRLLSNAMGLLDVEYEYRLRPMVEAGRG